MRAAGHGRYAALRSSPASCRHLCRIGLTLPMTSGFALRGETFGCQTLECDRKRAYKAPRAWADVRKDQDGDAFIKRSVYLSGIMLGIRLAAKAHVPMRVPSNAAGAAAELLVADSLIGRAEEPIRQLPRLIHTTTSRTSFPLHMTGRDEKALLGAILGKQRPLSWSDFEIKTWPGVPDPEHESFAGEAAFLTHLECAWIDIRLSRSHVTMQFGCFLSVYGIASFG